MISCLLSLGFSSWLFLSAMTGKRHVRFRRLSCCFTGTDNLSAAGSIENWSLAWATTGFHELNGNGSTMKMLCSCSMHHWSSVLVMKVARDILSNSLFVVTISVCIPCSMKTSLCCMESVQHWWTWPTATTSQRRTRSWKNLASLLARTCHRSMTWWVFNREQVCFKGRNVCVSVCYGWCAYGVAEAW